MPGEETLKPVQKLETKQPAAEQKPAAPKADKKQPGKPRAKKEEGAGTSAGQAPMYDYDEDMGRTGTFGRCDVRQL